MVTILRMLAGCNYDLTLVVLNGKGELRESMPSSVDLVELNVNRAAFAVFGLILLLRKLQPNLIVSTTHHMNLATTLAGKISGVGQVAVRLSSSPAREIAYGELSRLHLYIIKWAYRLADFIIVPDKRLAQEVNDIFGADLNKARILKNPIDSLLIADLSKDAENPYDESRVNVVAAGRLREEKGFDTLIKAFRIVVDEDSNYVLHILGRDLGEGPELSRLVKNLGLIGHVVFWGEKSNPYGFYKHANVFVLASRWEGMPNVVLESLFLGTPVVATRCTVVIDKMIADGENGYLVDVDDEVGLATGILKHNNLVVDEYGNDVDVIQFFHFLTNQEAL